MFVDQDRDQLQTLVNALKKKILVP